MLATNALGLFLGLWSLICLIDYYFRLRNFRAYVRFAEKTGLVISPFQIRLYTGRFERSLLKWEFLRRPFVKRLLDLWFMIGIASAVAALVFMLWLVTTTLYVQLKPYLLISTKYLLSSTIGDSIATTTNNGGDANSETSNGVQTESTGSSIVPIIPGVNIPWSQLPLLFVVLAVSGIVHELGKRRFYRCINCKAIAQQYV
jgi:hypothetical protein